LSLGVNLTPRSELDHKEWSLSLGVNLSPRSELDPKEWSLSLGVNLTPRGEQNLTPGVHFDPDIRECSSLRSPPVVNTLFSSPQGDNFTPRRLLQSRGPNFVPRGEVKNWYLCHDFCALVDWHSGHCVRLIISRSWVPDSRKFHIQLSNWFV
jgi:hypothetical protein